MIITLIMYHCSMEEMVTLLYGSFAALGEWVNIVVPTTSHSKRVADWALKGLLFLDELRRKHPVWKTIWHQEWAIFLLESLFHNVTEMQRKEWQWQSERCPHPQQTNVAEEMAPEHPSVRTLLGSTKQEILDVVEWVHRGQYEVAPSVIPCMLQNQFIINLHEKLGKCLVRAGLKSVMTTAWSLSIGRRHLWACSSSWSRSPSANCRRKEVARWQGGDSLLGSFQPSSIGHRNRAQQHQS